MTEQKDIPVLLEKAILSLDEFGVMSGHLLALGWSRWVAPGPNQARWFRVVDNDGNFLNEVWARFTGHGNHFNFIVYPGCLSHDELEKRF